MKEAVIYVLMAVVYIMLFPASISSALVLGVFIGLVISRFCSVIRQRNAYRGIGPHA